MVATVFIKLLFKRVSLRVISISYRKDTKTLPFRNKTKVPAAWKIIGMDSLRDDVTLSAEQGVVPPLDEVLITAVFKATKAGPLPKKPVKMEVGTSSIDLSVRQKCSLDFS